MPDYPIIDVSSDAAQRSEPMGSKEKFWFGPPGQPGRLWKKGRPGTGEDWAEKIASEIAELLGIPHAIIDLATCDGEAGIVTPDFRFQHGILVHGNELMVKFVDPQYPAQGKNFGVTQHTVANVMAVLEEVEAALPGGLESTAELRDGADAFAGYLLLDALITNTDRHHENWAILLRPIEQVGHYAVELSPTYDHASSLGRERSEADRLARLDGRDGTRTVKSYLERAKCRFYGNEADDRPLSPLEAFFDAEAIRPDAAFAWKDRLQAVPFAALEEAVHRVPAVRMTETAKRFAIRMLELNRLALLEGLTPP